MAPLLQITIVAIYTASALVITLCAIYVVPDLWRAGRTQMRIWLSPDRHDYTDDLDELDRLRQSFVNRRLTRQERLEALADRGIDTWADYRGER
jgi:hypothetical protein